MVITEKQKEFLSKVVNNLDNIICEDNVTALLWEIDSLIIENGMTEDQDSLTPYGIKLQKTYDDIYYQNKKWECFSNI